MKINTCICGCIPKLTSDGGYMGNSNGVARLECQCGLMMKKSTYNLGYDVELSDLEIQVVSKWNSLFKK